MQLIARVHDRSELSRIEELMRSKGIPLFVREAGPPRGLRKWAVFVCINEQTADALQLLKDPAHQPKLSVDAREFEQAAYSSNLGFMGRWGTAVALVVLAVFVCLVLISLRYGL